jgi:hypothetical protein
MKIDPLINRRVIFKLRGHDTTMDATILRYDENGYWIRGGTLANYLTENPVSEPSNDVRYLEFVKIEWSKAYESPTA